MRGVTGVSRAGGLNGLNGVGVWKAGHALLSIALSFVPTCGAEDGECRGFEIESIKI